MGTITNPHQFSTTTGATTSAQITDTIDYPHSGLIKSLSLGIRGNYVIKSSHTCFDITFAQAGGFTTIAVVGGDVFRNGSVKTVDALSAEPMDTSYNPGTGAVDITPHATQDFYLLLVAKHNGSGNDTMVLRGSNAVTGRVPDYAQFDVPIALIKVTAGSADDSVATSDRLVQYLTTEQTVKNLSVGYDDNGYNEAGLITGLTTGTTIESIGTLTLDADATKLTASASGKPTLTLENTASVASAAYEPQIIFDRTGTSDSSTSGDLGQIVWRGKESGGAVQDYVVLHGEALDETHPSEDGRLRLTVARAGSDGFTAGTSEFLRISGSEGVIFNHEKIDINFAIMGDTNDNIFTVDAGTEVTNIRSLSVGTAGELTITESSDDVIFTNTVNDKDIKFVVNDASGNDSTATLTCQTAATAGIADDRLVLKGVEEVIIVALSDETTDLTTGTGKVVMHMPFAMTLTGVKASVNTAPQGADIIVDINETGSTSTIMNTHASNYKLTIVANEMTSTTATGTKIANITDTALADNAALFFDIDQVGSSTAGKGLKVTLYGYRT